MSDNFVRIDENAKLDCKAHNMECVCYNHLQSRIKRLREALEQIENDITVRFVPNRMSEEVKRYCIDALEADTASEEANDAN